MATLIINPSPVNFTLTAPTGVRLSFDQPSFTVTTNGVLTQTAAWGDVAGNITDQTDLQTALNAKANLSGASFTGNIIAPNLSGTNTGDETNTTIGALIGSAATPKTTLVDADQFGISDSEGSNILKKFSWLNLKTSLINFFVDLTSTQTIGGVKSFNSSDTLFGTGISNSNSSFLNIGNLGDLARTFIDARSGNLPNVPILLRPKGTAGVGIGTGVFTPADVLHVRGGNVSGARLESTAACTVCDFYSTGSRNWSWRSNFNVSGFELLRSTIGGGAPTTTVIHFDANGNMAINKLNATERLDVAGNIALSGNIVSSGITARQLLSITQTNLASNYSFTAGAGEEEVPGLRVTLPIIPRVCTLEILHVVYTASAPGDNDYRVRIGTSLTATSNALIDGKYVGGAKILETMTGMIIRNQDLTNQTYINYTLFNAVNRASASLSASGSRSSIIVKIYA